MANYPAIPEPTNDPNSLRDSVLALKQAFEILSGQKGVAGVAAATTTQLNAVKDTLQPILTRPWTPYTPVFTSTTGAPTAAAASGRYKQIGKTIIAQVEATIATVGPASGDCIITVPVPPASFRYVGSSIDVATGKSGYAFLDGINNPTVMTARDATFTQYWAAGNIILITIVYEAA